MGTSNGAIKSAQRLAAMCRRTSRQYSTASSVPLSSYTAASAEIRIESSRDTLDSFDAHETTRLVDGLLSHTRDLMGNGVNQHVIAFSGGIDSSLVAALLHQSQTDEERVQAILGLSPAVPQEQIELAQEVAQHIGVSMSMIQTTEGKEEMYIQNAGQACLACKTNLYSSLQAVVDHIEQDTIENGSGSFHLYNGTNADDLQDPTRLGLVAARNFQVLSPLDHLSKSEVRQAAKHLGLPNWNYAASPCLRSRLALGVPATADHLHRVEEAERFVRARLGHVLDETCNLRVRLLSKNRARIELDSEHVPAATEVDWEEKFVQGLGFSAVSIRAFRSGSVATQDEKNSPIPQSSVLHTPSRSARTISQRNLQSRSIHTCTHRERFFSSVASLTPEATGRRAKEMAVERGFNELSSSMDTRLSHAGISHQQDNGRMSPPLEFSTTFTRPADGIYLSGDSTYSRADNPTRLIFEKEVASLECHGSAEMMKEAQNQQLTCAFASGMMAASAIVLAHTSPLHVVLPKDLYHGVPTVLWNVFQRFQVHVHQVDLRDKDETERTIRSIPNDQDGIVWIETPSNPQCQILDIQSLCAFVRSINPTITAVVDSTLAPPSVQRPLLLGADIVMHSATKYIGGHSDVTAGVATCNPLTERGQELLPKLRETAICVGGVASPMDSWLAIRGLRTLGIRAKKQSQSALTIAKFLESQMHEGDLVTKVHYPGLANHSDHDIASKQMLDGQYGGVLSFEMPSASHAMALAGALQTIQRATSLGGTETLIEHRASIEPPERVVSPAGLLRISVGLEEESDLIRDVSNALEITKEVLS